jgi:hypothetical protein
MSPTLDERSNTKARTRKAGSRSKKTQSAKAERSAREQISELTAEAAPVETLEQGPVEIASTLAASDLALSDEAMAGEAASGEASAMTAAPDPASAVIDVPLDSPISEAPAAASMAFSETVSLPEPVAADVHGGGEAIQHGGSRKVPLVAARMLDEAIGVQTEYAKQVYANFFETPLILCKLYSGMSRRMLTSWQNPMAPWRS